MSRTDPSVARFANLARRYFYVGVPALLATLATCGCGETQSKMETRFAPGFFPDRPTVAVLGVFKDGRMTTDYWKRLGPALSAGFAPGACEVLFGERLSSSEPKVYADIDKQMREEGLTPELVHRLAPRSLGSYIMLVDVYGKLPQHPKGEPESAVQPSFGGGRGGRGSMGPSSHRAPPIDDNALQLTVSLISADTGEASARVAMRYTGSSVDEALAKFSEQFRTTLPNATCAGWKWDGPPKAAENGH